MAGGLDCGDSGARPVAEAQLDRKQNKMDAAVRPILEKLEMAADGSPLNALSVDVEEYFQVAAFEGTVPREQWDLAHSRVEFSTGRVLDLFGSRGLQGTFFVLGWIA